MRRPARGRAMVDLGRRVKAPVDAAGPMTVSPYVLEKAIDDRATPTEDGFTSVVARVRATPPAGSFAGRSKESMMTPS